ncbi:MAG: hypothetical protein ACYDH3_11455, partial [Candidatus Aminicenantales bacterium]
AQWHAGADARMIFDTFRPAYAFSVGPPDRYVNRASGFEAGVLLGYDIPLSRILTLEIEVRSATNRGRWELDTDDGDRHPFPDRRALSLLSDARLFSP